MGGRIVRQTVAVKGAVFDGKYHQEAIEVWTDGEIVSYKYKDMVLAAPIEPIKKLITQVRKGNGRQHTK